MLELADAIASDKYQAADVRGGFALARPILSGVLYTTLNDLADSYPGFKPYRVKAAIPEPRRRAVFPLLQTKEVRRHTFAGEPGEHRSVADVLGILAARVPGLREPKKGITLDGFFTQDQTDEQPNHTFAVVASPDAMTTLQEERSTILRCLKQEQILNTSGMRDVRRSTVVATMQGGHRMVSSEILDCLKNSLPITVSLGAPVSTVPGAQW